VLKRIDELLRCSVTHDLFLIFGIQTLVTL